MQALNAPPWFKELLAQHQSPCISIYHPVNRANPREEDIDFKNVSDEVRDRLGGKNGYGAKQAQAALKRLEQTLDGIDLRDHRPTALAVFCSADHAHVIDLSFVAPRAVVIADTFHVKPMIRGLQQNQRFRVLCVAPRLVRLFEGDAHALTELKLSRDVPKAVDDIVAETATGPDTTPQSSTGGEPITNQPSYPPGNVAFDRFCRMVDHAIWEDYSQRDHLPVIVAADVKALATFLRITKNDYVMKEGIQLDPSAATPDRLRAEAWKILEPHFQQQIQTLKDAYHAAKARHLGSDEVPEVAEAAAFGRVGTLLVDSDARIPGILHRDGMIEPATKSNRADDLLDDLAEMVLKMDGQVLVLPHTQMPTDHGLAAIYRY